MDTREVEQIKKTTNSLRVILFQFRNSKYYKENEYIYQSMIPNLEIIIALTEKGLYDKRAICKDEEFWFGHSRYIEDAFNLRETIDYKIIYNYYEEIVDFVNTHNFFR